MAVFLFMLKNFFFITGIFLSFVLSQEQNVRILFTGDVTLSNHFESHTNDNFDYAFAKLPWFKEADITMVNLENPLTTEGIASDKQFVFKARPDYVNILKKAGIDIVTLANNHIYDFGDTGLLNTLEYLDKNNIYYSGAGRHDTEARHPVIFFKKGLKLAFLSYYGTHKHSDSNPAENIIPGTAMRRLDIIKEDITKIRNDVDYIFINFHWGIEKSDYPGADQIDFAHSVIDFGADFVIGHHPHVLQGVEKYNNKIIAYSLGNFIFGGNSRTQEDTAIIEIIVNKDDYNINLIPMRVEYWQPYKLTGQDSLNVLNQIKNKSEIFKNPIFD